MKKGQYRILMAVLWICFLTAALRILFILDPDMGTHSTRQTIETTEKEAGVEGGSSADVQGQEGSGDLQEPGESLPQHGGAEADTTELEEPDANLSGGEPKNNAGWKAVVGCGEEEPASPSDGERHPPRIAVASDLHYQSAETTDYGAAFEKFVKEGDGKVNAYLPQLLDALIDQLIAQKPDACLLTGDITINGERINHLELAGKLKRLNDAGIQTLVIPGNHDINNYRGRLYFGDEEIETESVSLEEFTEIYKEFGWDQAISRDEGSFSYVYPLRRDVWLMLLDTAQYDPLNIVDGAVGQETLRWMEENLEKAREEGIQVIVSGHHNLLQESRMFTTMCVLENSSQVTELLEAYQIPLYISGHLHLQRIQQHRSEPGAEEYGICEIVSDAISIPPCQYGMISWDESGAITYETQQVDVSSWAERTGQTDENLLDFDTYQKRHVREVIRDQILEQTDGVPESAAESMADLYAGIYADYCAGVKVDHQAVKRSDGYRSWERYLPDSSAFRELRAMLKDSMQDNNFFVLWGEETG